jgi:hypothetical protein
MPPYITFPKGGVFALFHEYHEYHEYRIEAAAGSFLR